MKHCEPHVNICALKEGSDGWVNEYQRVRRQDGATCRLIALTDTRVYLCFCYLSVNESVCQLTFLPGFGLQSLALVVM